MSDAMSNTELLLPGKNPTEIGVGRQEYLGSGSEAGAADGAGGFHQPTWAEQNQAAAAVALIRASAAGRVELSPTVGVPDPIEDYFVKMATPEGLRKLQEFLARPDVVSWDEDKVVPIKNTPGLPLGEMKRVVEAIQAQQGKGKSVEQLVRGARRPAPPPPEPQPAPRAGDWRDSFQANPTEEKLRGAISESVLQHLSNLTMEFGLENLLETIEQLRVAVDAYTRLMDRNPPPDIIPIGLKQELLELLGVRHIVIPGNEQVLTNVFLRRRK